MGKIQAKSIFRLVPIIGDLGRFFWAFTLNVYFLSYLMPLRCALVFGGPLLAVRSTGGQRCGVNLDSS